MRHKDEKKYDAICNAAIQLINEIGFAQASMSKIAKKAGVSPASIYTYFDNKEDMLVKLYIRGKREMADYVAAELTPGISLESATHSILKRLYHYTLEHRDFFAFTEQFSNSPLIHCIQQESMESFYAIVELYKQGIRDKIIRDLPMEIISAFSFFPVMSLCKAHLAGEINITDDMLDTIADLAWKAITV